MKTITLSESIAIKYLRAVATIFIVVCHYLQALNNHWAYVFNVGVQLFFVMSGYLYGFRHVESWDTFFFKRWKKLYIPYIIFIVVIVLALWIFLNEKVQFVEIIKHIYLCHGFIGNAFSGAGHLWFITAIFACYWITPLLQKVISIGGKSSSVLLIFFGFLSFLFLSTSTISNPLIWWYSWFFNYTVGYFLSRSTEKVKYIYFFISMVFLIFIIFSISWNDLLEWKTPINVAFHACTAHVVFIIFILISRVIPLKKVIQPFCVIEAYSFYIYLVHYAFTMNPWSVVNLTNSVVLNVFLLGVFIFISTFVLSFLSKYVEKGLDWFLYRE